MINRFIMPVNNDVPIQITNLHTFSRLTNMKYCNTYYYLLCRISFYPQQNYSYSYVNVKQSFIHIALFQSRFVLFANPVVI